MNEHDATRLLDRRAESVPAGVIPVDEVIAGGRTRVRRRRAAMAGVSMFTVIAIAGAVVVQQGAAGDPDGGRPASEVLDAPDGTRLVGLGRVVVAVPTAWSTGSTRCYKPVADTVYYESGAMTDCSDEPTQQELRAASSLAVSSSQDAGHYGFIRTDEMSTGTPVDGAEVLEGPVRCTSDALPVACSQEFAVPSEEVAFRITFAGRDARADVAAVRASLRMLPEGYTTVPLHGLFDVDPALPTAHGETPTSRVSPRAVVAQLSRAIRNAELDVVMVREQRPALESGTYLGSEPALGSPVEVASTVTLTVAD
jgi:hypothetical protein